MSISRSLLSPDKRQQEGVGPMKAYVEAGEVQGNKRIYSIVDPFVRDLVETIDCRGPGEL